MDFRYNDQCYKNIDFIYEINIKIYYNITIEFRVWNIKDAEH